MMMLEKLKRSLESAPIVRMGTYDYFVHPITDGIPEMDPGVFEEVIDGMLAVGDFNCDLIVTPEAMGIPLAVGLSQRIGVPYNVVRKKRYGLDGEVSVSQVTGYSKSQLYINGIRKGDRVTVVDDVISTGGTLRAVVLALKRMGVEIVDVIAIIEKTSKKKEIEDELGVRIKTLVKVEVREGRLVVLT